MKNISFPSGIFGLILIAVILFQRKEYRATQLVLQQTLARLELVESDLEELKPKQGLIAAIQGRVKRLGKDLQTLEVLLKSPQGQSQSQSFPPKSRIAVFVDAANVEIAARRKGWKIDYQKLKQELTQYASEVVGLFYYTAGNKNNSNLEGYQIVSKKLVHHRDGTVEGNLDPEIMRDLMANSGEFGTAIVVSGDGDFSCFIKYLQQNQKQVIVVGISNREPMQTQQKEINA